MNERDHLQWDHYGKCTYRKRKERPCPGIPGWSGGCQGRYKDDYGSQHWCPTCTYGDGVQVWFEYIRVPEFDAPEVPKKWKPDFK